MDLITEIRRLKLQRETERLLPSQPQYLAIRSDMEPKEHDDQLLDSPVPYFATAWIEVHRAIRDHCQIKGVSYAEFLERTRMVDRKAVDQFTELDEQVDCDIYGRWLKGNLTYDELKSFYHLVDNWRDQIYRLLGIHGGSQF